MILPLLEEIKKLNEKYLKSKSVDAFYFEPGSMENLDCYWGEYSREQRIIRFRTESKGLRYENRTFVLDRLYKGDRTIIVRDPENKFNSNNFIITTEVGEDIGNLPATVCNVLAPCVDNAIVQITNSHISHIERLSERSRYAKSGILFVEIEMKILIDTNLIEYDNFGGENG